MWSSLIPATLLLSCSITSIFAADRDINFPLGGPGLQISVLSSTKFCFFLPPNQNQTVADSEGNPYDAAHNATARAQYAVAYCTELGLPGTEGARLMPPGCLKSAHFVQGNNQVQITGQIDPVNCNNVVQDGGGYYDLSKYVNSPPGGICYDYGGFINVLNPIDNLFCIRCCKDPENLCGVDQGDRGCSAAMFAGVDVSPGFTDGNKTVAGPQTANPTSTPTPGANSTGNGNTGNDNGAAGSKSGVGNGGVSVALVLGLVTVLVALVSA